MPENETAVLEEPATTAEPKVVVAELLMSTALDFVKLVPELADDLGTLNITDVASFDQARRDAIASRLMTFMAEESSAMEAIEESHTRERELLAHRYDMQIQRHARRFDELRLAVEAIAAATKEAKGFVKKKSRDVGAGTYGFRTSSAAPALQDEAAYLVWAEDVAPQTLRVKLTMPLARAKEYLTTDELKDVKREIMRTEVTSLIKTDPEHLPPGYVMAPEKDEFFAKPLPLAAIR